MADERIPHLLRIPAKVRFLSVEPQLGPVNLCKEGFLGFHCERCGGMGMQDGGLWDGTAYASKAGRCTSCDGKGKTRGVDWVICGGESGGNARPFQIEWARSLRDQCKAAGVAFFMKQMGAKPYHTPPSTRGMLPLKLIHSKGEDMAEWPADIKIQEFPKASA
jgi:protein gp37